MQDSIYLVLTFKWYDLMIDGLKDVEYRAIVSHWLVHLWYKRDVIRYARFARGYTNRSILRPVKLIDVGPCPYPEWNDSYFRLHLGPIVSEL